MSRLETRVVKLEAAHLGGEETPYAVVRYNPGKNVGWLPGMVAAVGWPASMRALVTIDASGNVGDTPQVIVPPVPCNQLTIEQAAAAAQAGARPGPWLIAVTGRGWSDAIPMHHGEAALLAQLRAERQQAGLGWTGGR